MVEVSENIFSYIKSLYGEPAAKKYVEFIKQDPTQYIRVNTIKTDKEALTGKLMKDYSIATQEIPQINNALKVTGNSEMIGKTLEHIIGEYYIQGLSSMIPPLVLSPSNGDVVLDLCAAPGSKTTGLGEIMENGGTLIANEIALDRVKMLVYNIDRMNLVNAGVIHYKGEWLSKIYSGHFDKILVDAPCSGLGIVQKKSEVSNWWSKERAEKLGDLQLRLLIAAIKMLKEGGEVVYSTCTLTPEENEFIINKVLQKYPVEILDIDLPVSSTEGITFYNGGRLNPAITKARRILPWEADSDGFFIVKLKKTGETESPEIIRPKEKELHLLDYKNKELRKLLTGIENEFGIDGDVLNDYKFMIKRNDIYFVNKQWYDENLGLFERIGTRFGVIDKNSKVILHTQAAQILRDEIRDRVYKIENPDELKIYLDGGIIKTKIEFSGQCAVKYKENILGTAVVTANGIKSRFPRAKRTQEILIR